MHLQFSLSGAFCFVCRGCGRELWPHHARAWRGSLCRDGAYTRSGLVCGASEHTHPVGLCAVPQMILLGTAYSVAVAAWGHDRGLASSLLCRPCCSDGHLPLLYLAVSGSGFYSRCSLQHLGRLLSACCLSRAFHSLGTTLEDAPYLV